MWTIELRLGRLVEARVQRAFGAAEAEACTARLREAIAQTRQLAIVCIDCRAVSLFEPAAADVFRQMVVDRTTVVLKGAVLVSTEAGEAVAQVDRMVREAGQPQWRWFGERPSLELWLATVLTPSERTRLAAFLAAP